MIRPILLAGALLFVSQSALADPRLVTRRYADDQVVRIEGRTGVQAAIAFAEDEHIENVAIGDSNAWQVTPNKRTNMLFIKPLSAGARTNMTVVTDRHAYYFDLAASPSAMPLYVLRFTYPDEPKQAAGPAPQLTQAELQASAEPPIDPANLNFAWKSEGARKLFPARIFDDGRSTFVTWPAGGALPAILIRNEKGAEGPVNFAVRGDTIVIEGVPALLVLRLGKDAATLLNQGAPRSSETPALAAVSSQGN
jgi:type IV secretion system protein VirB9